MEIAFPFRIDGQGRVASSSKTEHIRQMIEQLLFTLPGERVNHPTFGSGLQQIIFQPNQTELLTATQTMIQATLQQWLGDLIQVEHVIIQSEHTIVKVDVQYLILPHQERQIIQFTQTH